MNMNPICSLLLCLCIALTGCAAGGGAAKPTQEAQTAGEIQPTEAPQMQMEEAELRPLVPDEAPTHAEVVQDMLDLIAAARDSCARMLEEAEAKGDDAMKLAEAARAENEPRLTELAGLDYDAMTDDEIYRYMSEVSDILTAFRQARDSIGEPE